MLRGYVLRYLALVATGASMEVARTRVPAPLRAFVMKAAQKRTIAAGFETEHAGDAAHLHRLAYLSVISAPTIDDNDIEGVRATFSERRQPSSEARASIRLVASLLVLAVVLSGAAGLYWYATTPSQSTAAAGPVEEEDRPDLEELLGMDEPAEPAHVLDSFFKETLPDFVVALDRRSSGQERASPDDVAGARSAVLDALNADAPALAPSMGALLDAAQGYVDRAPDADDTHWSNALVLFHDALREADAPFYVDATLRENLRTGRRRVLLSTWDVRERRTFHAGDARVRALDITRKDTLNFERSLLGYTRPEVRHALVVVDRIERFLVEQVLPSVNAAADSVIVRDYAHESGTTWVTSFEEWAHEDLRREAEGVVSDDMGNSRALDDLAGAIVRRRNGVAALSGSVEGVELRDPSRYDYDVARLNFSGDFDRAALRNVRQAERDLHVESVVHAYRLLLDARALSVAEHEVQHRLDYEADRLIAVPEQLSRYTGETESLDGVNRRAERANAELSAYLSQIAQRPSLAWTSLVHVASFMMSRPSWSMPEAYAAVALFESVATEAGIDHRALIRGRSIDRGEVARIYGELRRLSSAELSALAGRTWATLYGAELTEIRLAE